MRFGRRGRFGHLAVTVALALAVIASTAAAQPDDPVKWSLAKTPASAGAGQTFRIDLTATLETGWHMYSISQPPGGPITTRISVAKNQPFTLAGAIEAPSPQVGMDQNFGMETETYADKVVFTLPIKVSADASGKQVLRVQAYYQTCNDKLCYPPKTVTIETPFEVKGGGSGAAAAGTQAAPAEPAAAQAAPSAPTAVQAQPSAPATTAPVPAGKQPPSAAIPARAAEERPPSGPTASPVGAPPAASTAGQRTPNPGLRTPDPGRGTVPAAPAQASDSILSFLLLAMVSGALALLTPCVFPMVPITVSYFTGHAAGHQGRALRNASIYAIGIVLTFTAFGLLLALLVGATSLNRFAANPWINLLITAIFVGFALNLFGVFEINVPSAMLSRLDKVTRQEGGSEIVGALLMGFTFTLTSFTCTVPFVGNVVVAASNGSWIQPVIGMAAFATVFALPFFVLALMPQWVSQMPRSGAWLHAVKVLMAFLEIAAAMKFISNVDLVWRWGIFTREVVLAIWVVIAALMALYLLGVFKFPGEPRIRKVRVGRWSLAAACLLLGVWLFSGIMGRRLGELDAFLPPAEGALAFTADQDAAGIEGELTWIMNDYAGALARAQREHKRVMVDFTGYTCTNCRWMEANMFPRADVRAELAKYVRVRMYTDGEGEIFQKQQQMQQAMFKTVALPYYAILESDGTPVVTYPGLTRDPAEFVTFLKSGMSGHPSTNP
jgi:thiol:disulfide interchange protein DsbD